MANLSANQIAGDYMFNDNECIYCTTPKCFKISSDTLYKKHNHSPNNLSQAYRNANKFIVHHQIMRGISNKTDEF